MWKSQNLGTVISYGFFKAVLLFLT